MRLMTRVTAVLAVGAMLSMAGGASSGVAKTSIAPANAPVKLGLIGPTSSGTPVDIDALLAVDRAAIRALNARGGLAGHSVELDYCNDKGDPNLSAACARKMVSDGVIAMAGGNNLNGPAITAILAKA